MSSQPENKGNPLLLTEERFAVLDIHEKIEMFLPQSGICCCAYTVQVQSWCDVPWWAMGFPSARHILCDKKLRDEI